ncbi:hypothetical protein [Oleisolibacter albus]|uniref:hypothetical protein n=1 Tax=Oleisolibacter albus TaxID=2171757 RepID=UPI000DF1D819|nr:hypothetical protein [Oleisolibacter albus]
MPDDQKFALLGRPRRIWAVGAIHGEADRLAALHDDIGTRFLAGDRLVYLGNMVGRGSGVRATLDEVLAFRRQVLAIRSVIATDIVYLRGGQEEMWQKLLQLQFAPNPSSVLQWMLGQGLEATLAAYGGDAAQGLAAARDGAVSLTRWTNQLRAAQRAAPGHDALFSALKRAAYSSDAAGQPGPLLFVNAGLDVNRPLAVQGDRFWWGGSGFSRIDAPYGEFMRIVRGYDPTRSTPGPVVSPHAVTLDGGTGHGGHLICGCFAPDGSLLEIVEA